MGALGAGGLAGGPAELKYPGWVAAACRGLELSQLGQGVSETVVLPWLAERLCDGLPGLNVDCLPVGHHRFSVL